MQAWFCCRVLPKPIPGSSKIGRGHAGARGEVERALEETLDVIKNVDRRIGAIPVVHDDDRRASFRHGVRHAGIALQAPDVVDDTGAEPRRLARDLGLACVNRDRRIEFGQRLECGNNPPQLFVFRNRNVTRPCRFAADIDDRRAIGDHGPGARDSCGKVGMAPAVGERIRRHVENAHEHGDVFSALRNPSRWVMRRSMPMSVGYRVLTASATASCSPTWRRPVEMEPVHRQYSIMLMLFAKPPGNIRSSTRN